MHQSAVDPAGILMLGSIRKIFKLIGIEPEYFQFRKEEFNSQTIIDALIKSRRNVQLLQLPISQIILNLKVYQQHRMLWSQLAH